MGRKPRQETFRIFGPGNDGRRRGPDFVFSTVEDLYRESVKQDLLRKFGRRKKW